MTLEEILARCLDALEQGETIEHCLARYPQYATELLPLLRVATVIRSTPQPRLSPGAYRRGRAAVIAQARYQQSRNTPFQATHDQRMRTFAATRLVTGVNRKAAQPPQLAPPLRVLHRTTYALVTLTLLLGFFVLLHNISISLPTSPLYPAKILSERVEGTLIAAMGEQAAWQAQQTEQRLQELAALTAQHQPVPPTFLTAIDQQVAATLAASQQLPVAQRERFLQAWWVRLQKTSNTEPTSAVVAATLRKTLSTIQAANPRAAQIVASPAATAVPSSTKLPATPRLAVAATASAQQTAVQPVAVATPVLPTTATPVVVEVAPTDAAPIVMQPTTAPSAPVAPATATMAALVLEMPREQPADHPSHQGHTKAAAAPPAATATPAVAPVAAVEQSETPVASTTGTGEVQAADSITTTQQTTSEATQATVASTDTATPIASATDLPTAVPTPTATEEPVVTQVTPLPTDTPLPIETALPLTSEPTTAQVTPTPTDKAATPTPTAKKTATEEPPKTTEPSQTAPATETPNSAATPAVDIPTAEQQTTELASPTSATPAATPRKHKP